MTEAPFFANWLHDHIKTLRTARYEVSLTWFGGSEAEIRWFDTSCDILRFCFHFENLFSLLFFFFFYQMQ